MIDNGTVHEDTVCHEFGHFMHYVMNNDENTPEFQQIYKTESLKIHDAYADSSASEYYACMFALYIANPNNLKNVAPQTYNYFNVDVNQLNTIYQTIYNFNKNRN